jgi:glycosyltransferase involved in cell wall biosynthesis
MPVPSRAPRALYCTDTYPPQLNGVSVVTALSVAGLQARGWEVAVVGPRYPRSTPTVFRGEAADGEEAILAAIPSVALPSYPDIRLAFPARGAVARAFDAFEPDVVHCATEFVIGRMGQRLAINRSIPVVSSYHTDFSRYAVEYGMPRLREPVRQYIGRFHRRSLQVYTPGHLAADELHRLGVNNVLVWGRGVDVARFHPARRDQALHDAYAPDGAALCLHVGRLAAEKGVERILSGFATARSLLPSDRAVRLVIAGSGPEEAALRAAAPEGVIFLGNLDRTATLPALYASADLFLFASHTETLGLVVLESMASGVPVIAAPAGGVADHLRDNVNGLAYPPGDCEAMARAIVALVVNPARTRALGAAARRTAELLSWENELDRLDASYRRLIGREVVEPAVA